MLFYTSPYSKLWRHPVYKTYKIPFLHKDLHLQEGNKQQSQDTVKSWCLVMVCIDFHRTSHLECSIAPTSQCTLEPHTDADPGATV